MPDSAHPQWITIDLGQEQEVNTVVIDWAAPYAVNFKLEYSGNEGVSQFNNVPSLKVYSPGIWHALSKGNIVGAKGGKTTIVFSDVPLKLRLLRILCLQSSKTALPGCTDARDSAGYAIREVALGITKDATFSDYVKHGKTNKEQSVIYASTTDPWHRAIDIDPDTEQPGVDFVFRNGLKSTESSVDLVFKKSSILTQSHFAKYG